MPVKVIINPGDTVSRGLQKVGTDYDAVHDAVSASGLIGRKHAWHSKPGSNYQIIRGAILYDFRSIAIPAGVRIIKAQLLLSDTFAGETQTNGNKVQVGWIFNPASFGSVSTTDFNKSRFSPVHNTSAQTVASGADNVIIEIDNRFLLQKIQDQINAKTYLHLIIRNNLDVLDTEPTGLNRISFDMPSGIGSSTASDFNDPLKLRLFYRILGDKVNVGGRGAGGVASAGFGGTSLFAGTNSGFSN